MHNNNTQNVKFIHAFGRRSIDFTANMTCNAKITTHSSQTTPLQQLCVIYDVAHVENAIDKRAYCFHSNRTKYGWHSATPI